MPEPLATSLPNALVSILVVGHPMPLITTRIPAIRHHHPVSAHETLKNITTIIMRTSDDNRGQLFLALFQGFQFLGNLPITLVFHEAPTGTQA